MTTVLVAEDDDGVRSLLVTALRRNGYEVLSAADGQAALALLDRDDLVIDARCLGRQHAGRRRSRRARTCPGRRPGIALVLASGTDRWSGVPGQVASDVTLLEKPYRLGPADEALETACTWPRPAADHPVCQSLVTEPVRGLARSSMSDPELRRRSAHHFTGRRAVPGTLRMSHACPRPHFVPRLFTKVVTSWELGGGAEDHPYSSVLIEGTIPGFVAQTRHPGGGFPGGGRRADRRSPPSLCARPCRR